MTLAKPAVKWSLLSGRRHKDRTTSTVDTEVSLGAGVTPANNAHTGGYAVRLRSRYSSPE